MIIISTETEGHLTLIVMAECLQHIQETMKNTKLQFVFIIFIIGNLAQGVDSLSQQVAEVSQIAKAIRFVNKRVGEAKSMEYASAIHRSAQTYKLDAALLVAIAQQETGFRENLPEGKAGEIGIVQIRKHWLKDETFIKEFGHQTLRDLETPSKSFVYAGWLLSDLRKKSKKSVLPFWAYYNSVKFNNRLTYFLGVNRHLTKVRTVYAKATRPTYVPRTVAAASSKTKDVSATAKPLPKVSQKDIVSIPEVVVPRIPAKKKLSLFAVND